MYTAWRRFHAARQFDGGGFTLIEVLISIVILTFVMSAITVALITIFNLYGSTAARISDSSDAQAVSANLVNDVQSATEITTDPGATGPGPCGTGTQLLGLEWSQGQTVVSYMDVKRGSTWALVRNYCTGGSSTPTSSSVVSFDICEPSGSPIESGCKNPQSPPALTPAADNNAAVAGWIAAKGVTGVSFAITEPGSQYTYTLVADPEPANAPNTQASSVVSPNTTCGYAIPGTGTFASTLCFVSFSNYDYADAAYPACQTMTAGITGTPFTLSFCLSVLAGTESNGEAPPASNSWSTSGGAMSCDYGTAGPVSSSGVPTPPNPPNTQVTQETGSPGNLCGDPSSADIVAVPLPTYTNPPGSEAFLGNNGFYTGVPGDPALYTYLEGTQATLYLTNIKVLDANGNAATNWDLVTGDAESTDTGESITWSTCPATSSGAQQVSCTGSPTPPDLSLIPNNPPPSTDYYGNACLNSEYEQDWLTTGSLVAGGGSPFTITSAAQEVECAAGVSENKTGTVMLEAPEPSTMTVNLVGTGLQAIFIGFLL